MKVLLISKGLSSNFHRILTGSNFSIDFKKEPNQNSMDFSGILIRFQLVFKGILIEFYFYKKFFKFN